MKKCLLAWWLLCFARSMACHGDDILKAVRVEPSGQIADEGFRAETGWSSLRRLDVAIELKQADETFLRVSPHREFRTGERFHLSVTSSSDMFVYVLVQNADGSHALLFPEKAGDSPVLRAGQEALIPKANSPFQFSGATGRETLRVLAASEALPDIAPEQLFRLESQRLRSDADRRSLERLQEMRSRTLQNEVKRQSGIRTVQTFSEAIQAVRNGKMQRGVQVVAVERREDRHSITMASPAPDDGQNSPEIVIAELMLLHRK